MLILCDLDSLEIVCPRDARHFSHGHGTFFWASLAALWYSRRRTVRGGDHHGLEWCEGCELGVWSLRRRVSRSSAPGSQSSRILGEGHSGGEGTLKSLIMGESSSQSDWSHLRRGGA